MLTDMEWLASSKDKIWPGRWWLVQLKMDIFTSDEGIGRVIQERTAL